MIDRYHSLPDLLYRRTVRRVRGTVPRREIGVLRQSGATTVFVSRRRQLPDMGRLCLRPDGIAVLRALATSMSLIGAAAGLLCALCRRRKRRG